MSGRAAQFSFSSWLFLRALAVIHLVAFGSYAAQAPGLVGPHGISPAGTLLAAVRAHYGAAALWQWPTLCWWLGADRALPWLAGGGIVLALLLFAGIAPAICLGLLWIDSLSLAGSGPLFFDYQWDALLIETTFLAIWIAPWSWWPAWRRPEPPRLARWLLLWLLFRLMLLSGLVKLASGDPTWRNLTALSFHYHTQPLPTPFSWYADHFPTAVQKATCAAMFAVELLAPFTLFAGPRLRRIGVATLIALQVAIFLTGNYTFFNLLTVALCLLALDDAAWGPWPGRIPPWPSGRDPAARPPPWGLAPVAAAVVAFTTLEAVARFGLLPPHSAWAEGIIAAEVPFRSLNNYGLFARMTTTRPQLVIQGSDDGRDWRTYELPHQAGDLARRPDFIAPLQPRLDWQLWFAALESAPDNPWIEELCARLLQGTPEVLRLFARNPFPDHPPRYLRIVRYLYEFTTPAERAASGNWWKRSFVDFYVPPVALTSSGS
jgi:hypothetical protein